MRWLLVTLAAGLAAGAAWMLFAERRQAPQVSLARPPEVGHGYEPWMALRSGTLTVRVRGPDGQPLARAQVGYETPQGPRLYYTSDEGVRTLTGVPLGDLTVLVEAPGFAPVRRRTHLEAGLTEELPVIMTPAPQEPQR